MKLCFRLSIVFLLITACTASKLGTYDFPKPVDTSDRPIQMQEKGSWTLDGVTVSNEFEGARMNGFSQDNDSTFRVKIEPENEPINESPWYAFTISGASSRSIYLVLDYGTHKHRYIPKISRDLKQWSVVDSTLSTFEGMYPKFKIEINSNPLYFCGQELQNSIIVKEWFDGMCTENSLKQFTVGESRLGRELFGAESLPIEEKAETVVLIGRQHPPEVPGFLAMKSFIDELMNDSKLSTAFRKKYRILIYPLLNPDGVDLGHWRHNAGGIDTNRDWAYYRQPEIRQIANHIYDYVNSRNSNLILGIDFHSTQEDVYYTYPDEHEHLMDFRNFWIEGIEDALGEGNAYEDPDPLGSPVSKGWFIVHFGAEAVTYEVGDETPRDFIDLKARTSAKEMMKLLIMR